jgi:hypothetical protein
MRHLYNLIVLCGAMVFAIEAWAQPQHSMTLTTSANENSPLNIATNNRRQNLYIPSTDFPTATTPGAISVLYVKASASGTFNFATFTVRASNTPLAAFVTGPWTPGMSNIYSAGPVSFTTVSGNWIKIPLQNAIPYHPSQNFIIEFNQTGFSPGAVSICESAAAVATNRSLFGPSTNANGTVQTRLQQIGFDLAPSCDVPTNIKTSNITLTTADITFDGKLGSSQYEYLVDENRADPPSNGYYYTNTNSFSVQGRKPNTCYFIHIRSICPDPTANPVPQKVSAWTLDSFCTIPDCVMPEVTIDRITHNTAVASWDPVHTAYLYEYAVGTVYSTVPPTSGHTTTYTNILLQGLDPSKAYHFFVRAYCSPIPKSPWRTVPFHTLRTTGVESVSGNDDFAVQAYPNPATDVVLFRVFGDVQEKATIAVTNLVGGVIMNLPATGQETKIDISQLPAGLYMLKYTDGKHQQTTKIIKQ